METILVWTLVIATIAIVAMLGLLIASEREVKQKRIEIESLRTTLETTATAFAPSPNPLGDESTSVAAEMARLTEQVRANEVAIATMQCELEALRAENSWLKREAAAYRIKTPAAETYATEGAPTVPVESPPTAAISDRIDLAPRRRWRPFPAAATALLLLALVSVFLGRGKTPFAPVRKPDSSAEAQGNLPALDPTTDAAIPGDTKGESDWAIKPLSKRRPGSSVGTSYEVVRSTRVFSEPNEGSRPLARVEAGMEINVIGARDDWLEVRSRHGRPPGFIRKDTVVIKTFK
jgi:hypothetical protein